MIQPNEVFYGFAQTMPRSLRQCGGKCIIIAESKGWKAIDSHRNIQKYFSVSWLVHLKMFSLKSQTLGERLSIFPKSFVSDHFSNYVAQTKFLSILWIISLCGVSLFACQIENAVRFLASSLCFPYFLQNSAMLAIVPHINHVLQIGSTYPKFAAVVVHSMCQICTTEKKTCRPFCPENSVMFCSVSKNDWLQFELKRGWHFKIPNETLWPFNVQRCYAHKGATLSFLSIKTACLDFSDHGSRECNECTRVNGVNKWNICLWLPSFQYVNEQTGLSLLLHKQPANEDSISENIRPWTDKRECGPFSDLGCKTSYKHWMRMYWMRSSILVIFCWHMQASVKLFVFSPETCWTCFLIVCFWFPFASWSVAMVPS